MRPGLQLLGSLLHRSQPLLALQDLGVELVFGSVHDVLDVVGLELLPSYKQIFVSAHLTLRVGPSSQFGVGRRRFSATTLSITTFCIMTFGIKMNETRRSG